jgi:hypothetical protein
LLNEDRYTVGLLGHVPGSAILVNEPAVLSFEVLQAERSAGHGRQPGFIRPRLAWNVVPLNRQDGTQPGKTP